MLHLRLNSKAKTRFDKLFNSKESMRKYVKISTSKYRPFGAGSFLLKHNFVTLREIKYNKPLNKYPELLYALLRSWNIGQRGSKLCNFEKFKSYLIKFLNSAISKYEDFCDPLKPKITETDNEVIKFIINLAFEVLEISFNKSKIVPISKILFFLFPNLFLPIDRTYTIWFFQLYNSKNEEQYYYDLMLTIKYLISELDISDNELNNCRWDRKADNEVLISIPKLFDSAIIGYQQDSLSK